MYTFKTTENDEGRTLYSFIKKMMNNLPLSKIEKLFRKKDIKINGKRINDKKYLIQMGDIIVVYGVEQAINKVKINYKEVKINFDILFEDSNILTISKRSGTTMHGEVNSLDDQVKKYLKYKNNSAFEPSHVSRLDKVTTGIVIYTKTYEAQKQMKAMNNKFKKFYLLKSDLPEDTTTTYKLAHSEDLKREIVADHGRDTKTVFKVLDNNNVMARIKTGRKHQIRASISKLGYPIYGDRRYGGKRDIRVYLHSYKTIVGGLEGKMAYLNGTEFIDEPKWR